MQVKELKKEGLKREMEVTLPAQDISRRVEGRLKEVGKNMRIPGFRPGKAPMDLMKQRYGKAIMGEVLDIAVQETVAQTLKDKNIKPALQPKITVQSFDDGKDLVFTMALETLPEFEIKDFKGAKIEKLTAKPGAKDIDEALEKIAKGRREAKEVEGRKAKKGDLVIIDFHGRTADDNVEHPGMHAHGFRLELGSGSFVAGFEDQLIGADKGAKVEVKVTFPKEYGAQELAGRDAIFDVDVNEIREFAEAKIDDEFAKGFGKNSLDELKEAVKEQLQKEFDYHSRLYMKRGLMDYLDGAYDFEIPESMLDIEYQNIMDQLEMDRKQNPEGHRAEVTDEEKTEFKSIAARRVRLGLLLSEIGNKNGVKVSDPELQRAVIAEAQKYPGQERQVFDFFAKNRNALESLKAPIFEDKVVDYILALADISEKEVSPDELIHALDDAEEDKPAKKEKPAKAKKTAKGG